MKKLLSSVLFFALAGTAHSADIVAPEEPMVVNAEQITPAEPSSDRWAGAYFGVAIGQGYLADHAPLLNARAEGDDTIYGAFAGYNMQWGPFVAGVEASVDRANILFTDGSGIRSEFMYAAKLRGGLANDWAFAYATIGAEHGVTNLPAPFSKDTTLQLGAGIDFAVTRNLAIGANFTYAKYRQFADFTFFGSTVDVETKKLMVRMSYQFN
jgi:outer membrane immunogenic protein